MIIYIHPKLSILHVPDLQSLHLRTLLTYPLRTTSTSILHQDRVILLTCISSRVDHTNNTPMLGKNQAFSKPRIVSRPRRQRARGMPRGSIETSASIKRESPPKTNWQNVLAGNWSRRRIGAWSASRSASVVARPQAVLMS